MIISCPQCQTKYQVADKAIGSVGRKVQCANCQTSWQATADVPPRPKLVAQTEKPDPDRLFDSEAEAALDQEFEDVARDAAGTPASPRETPAAQIKSATEAVAEKKAGTAKKNESSLDDKLQSKRQRDLEKRQKALSNKLPMARVRRALRVVGLMILVGIIGGGIVLRTPIVRAYPDLGGIYAAVGLGVNVVGLEFNNVETLRTLRDGSDVMVITAIISNVAGRNISVPTVKVSLVGADGASLYQWTVRPKAKILGAGESVQFETQLKAAPADTSTVRLVFAAAGDTTNN